MLYVIALFCICLVCIDVSVLFLYCCMCVVYNSDVYCMYVCILGEHLVQAMPFVAPFPCDKIDNNICTNNNFSAGYPAPAACMVHFSCQAS